MSRVPVHQYVDPLDQIWLRAAERMGMRVRRSDEAYVHWDGAGTLWIATDEALDSDDCLAQMIFHEICHWLVEGAKSRALPDWGLECSDHSDMLREEGALRVQAALAAPHGLRRFLANTTEHRACYDALPEDPLSPRTSPGALLGRAAAARAEQRPWAPALQEALAATGAVVAAAAVGADANSLLSVADPRWPRNALDVPQPPFLQESCVSCAWFGEAPARCHRAESSPVAPSWAACERWESPFDCLGCGACCREGYDSVTIEPGEAIVREHPELIVARASYIELARIDGRCAALESEEHSYKCAVYDLRPAPCRELDLGSEHCLAARQRVGLSR